MSLYQFLAELADVDRLLLGAKLNDLVAPPQLALAPLFLETITVTCHVPGGYVIKHGYRVQRVGRHGPGQVLWGLVT